jgi:hypothetical protein
MGLSARPPDSAARLLFGQRFDVFLWRLLTAIACRPRQAIGKPFVEGGGGAWPLARCAGLGKTVDGKLQYEVLPRHAQYTVTSLPEIITAMRTGGEGEASRKRN